MKNKDEVFSKFKEFKALIDDTVEPNELWHRMLAHVHYRALPIASKAIEGLP